MQTFVPNDVTNSSVGVQKLIKENDNESATAEAKKAVGTKGDELLESSVKSKGASKGKEKKVVKQSRKDQGI